MSSPRLRILLAYHLMDFSLVLAPSIRALTSPAMRRYVQSGCWTIRRSASLPMPLPRLGKVTCGCFSGFGPDVPEPNAVEGLGDHRIEPGSSSYLATSSSAFSNAAGQCCRGCPHPRAGPARNRLGSIARVRSSAVTAVARSLAVTRLRKRLCRRLARRRPPACGRRSHGRHLRLTIRDTSWQPA